jgi:hypothetical protein
MGRFRPESRHGRLSPVAKVAQLAHAEGATWVRSASSVPEPTGAGGTGQRAAWAAQPLKIGEGDEVPTCGPRVYSAGRRGQTKFETVSNEFKQFQIIFKLIQTCFDSNRTFPSSKTLK